MREPTPLDRLLYTAAPPADSPATSPLPVADSPSGLPRALADVPKSSRPSIGIDAVIEITITRGAEDEPNTVVGRHNEEDDHTESGGGSENGNRSQGGDARAPVQGGPILQPRVTTATVTVDSPGTLRPTIPSLASTRIPPIVLHFEAAPEWVRRLPGPILMAYLSALPRPAGDTRVYGFPMADDVRVVLDGTTTDPGRVEIDGIATDILVHPVYDDAGEVTGFAPDSYFDQHELHRLTGAWIALSENGSAQDTTIVVVGEGSRRGPPAEIKGTEKQRRAAELENRSGLLIAGEESRHLEQIRAKTDQSTPDYIDIDTGERIDIYSPQGNVNTMRNEVRDKMQADQADIIVVNAYYSPEPLDRILGRIESMPRDRAVTVIDREGEFHYFDPNVDDPADLIGERPVRFG